MSCGEMMKEENLWNSIIDRRENSITLASRRDSGAGGCGREEGKNRKKKRN